MASDNRWPNQRSRKRTPGSGAHCTKCGATGDEKFGVTLYGTLDSWCKQCHRNYNKEKYRKANPGSSVRPTRMTPAEAQAIRESTESNGEIAFRLNLKVSHVWKIRHNKIWRKT